MAKTRVVGIFVVAFLVMAASSILIIGKYVSVDPIAQERSSLVDNLGEILSQMLLENGPGVGTDSDGKRFVTSFSAFYDYVRIKKPKDVSSIDSPNPFPGILMGKKYFRKSGTLQNASDLLIASDTYARPSGRISIVLDAGGSNGSIVGSVSNLKN